MAQGRPEEFKIKEGEVLCVTQAQGGTGVRRSMERYVERHQAMLDAMARAEKAD